MVLTTPHAITWVFTTPYQCIFSYAISGMIILSKIQLKMHYSVIVWVWICGRTFLSFFGWLTGRRDLHTSHNYTVFHRFWVCYQCLGSIHLIIYGYSYVTRLGWVFSRFVIHGQGCCCTAASIRYQRDSFIVTTACLFLIDLVCNYCQAVRGLYIERTIIRHSGWLTGGRGLHTVCKCVVFRRFGVFYHCLGSILFTCL